jgi:hypothetical protein
MKRLPQIGKELNVRVSTLLDYCNRLGHTGVSQHSKIDQQLENQIIDLHKGKINIPESEETSEYQISSTQELPDDFNLVNPFQLEEQEIISESNPFSKRNWRTIENHDSELKTIFSDFEAYSICSGLDDRHAKHLSREFFKKQEQTESEQFEAHTIAMAALEKYGSKTLSFIISLPPLPFKAVNATQIFSELDKRRKKQDFPILRITFKNDKNETEKIQISYYAEKIKNGRRRNDNVLTIKNRTTGQNLMRVSRNGIVFPETNAKQIVLVLQVFIRFSNDPKQTLLNYGLETGECSICGRELTDAESIRIGIGPVCRQYI